jgi:excisionase family DNA binding protein
MQVNSAGPVHGHDAVLGVPLPFLLTVPDVAELLRTTPAAIYSMKERGQLPGVTQVGRRVLFRSDKLVDWLRQESAPSLKEWR